MARDMDSPDTGGKGVNFQGGQAEPNAPTCDDCGRDGVRTREGWACPTCNQRL